MRNLTVSTPRGHSQQKSDLPGSPRRIHHREPPFEAFLQPRLTSFVLSSSGHRLLPGKEAGRAWEPETGWQTSPPPPPAATALLAEGERRQVDPRPLWLINLDQKAERLVRTQIRSHHRKRRSGPRGPPTSTRSASPVPSSPSCGVTSSGGLGRQPILCRPAPGALPRTSARDHWFAGL